MQRKFKLIAYLKQTDTEIDSVDLGFVTSPSGFGFKQKVTTQETDTIDYVVKQVVAKKPIKLDVNFFEPDSYVGAETFQNWLGKYLNLEYYKLTLQYSNGLNERLVDVYISDYDPKAKEAGVVTVSLTIQPLTPNYLRGRQSITITTSDSNKEYPYTYPYKYGGGSLQNNKLTNDFIAPIPLCVTLRGEIVNPEVSLLDENGDAYATIKFSGLTLEAGKKLVVDGINQRITFYESEDDETGIDYFNEIDKSYDTFLLLRPGTSEITANLEQTEASSPSIEVSYVKYMV